MGIVTDKNVNGDRHGAGVSFEAVVNAAPCSFPFVPVKQLYGKQINANTGLPPKR